MLGLVTTGLFLVIVGVAVMLIAMFSGSRGDKAEVRGGAVLMIGPIPIIFGSDAKWASVTIVLAIALVLVYLFGVL
jgi:uncharacterized protein (TIGR00304 family)